MLITRNLSEGPIPVAGAFTDPTGKYCVAHIDIRAVMSGKDPQGNILIKPHDVITVPRARMIYVLGNVTKPGGYVLTENETMSVTQAIALAGGWDKTAQLSARRVLRADGGAQREQIPANVKKIMENKAPDLQLRPDDILYIPNSMGKTVGARGLDSSHWARDRPCYLALRTTSLTITQFPENGPKRDPRLDGGPYFVQSELQRACDRFQSELDRNPKGLQKDDSDPADHSWTSLTRRPERRTRHCHRAVASDGRKSAPA